MLAESVVVFISCAIVDSLFLNPCCSLVRILFLAVCLVISLSIICSIILQHVHASDIGVWLDG